MPAREWFHAQEREPVQKQSAPAPEPASATPEPVAQPGLSPNEREQVTALLSAVRAAIGKPVVIEEPEREDPAARHRAILSGEAKPESLSELARAARWALQNRDQIEGN